MHDSLIYPAKGESDVETDPESSPIVSSLPHFKNVRPVTVDEPKSSPAIRKANREHSSHQSSL